MIRAADSASAERGVALSRRLDDHARTDGDLASELAFEGDWLFEVARRLEAAMREIEGTTDPLATIAGSRPR